MTESIFSAITERGSLTSRRGGASLVLGVERERTGGAEWVGVWWGTGGGYEDGEMQKERGGRAGGGERHAPYGVDLSTSVGSWEEVGDDIVICHRTTSGDGVLLSFVACHAIRPLAQGRSLVHCAGATNGATRPSSPPTNCSSSHWVLICECKGERVSMSGSLSEGECEYE